MDLDNILREVGQFGWYQIFIMVLLFFPNAFTSVGSITFIFATGEVEYRCRIPECDGNSTESYDQTWLKWAIPDLEDENRDRCLRYKTKPNSGLGNCSKDSFSTSETEFCHNYIYKNDENTMAKEFNLMCARNKWKRTLVGTMSTVAQFAGMTITGVISDRYGRKLLIVSTCLLSAVMGTLRSMSTSYEQYLTFEILDGFVSSGIYAAVYVYGIEVIGPDKRGLGGTIISSIGSTGGIILGTIAWLFHDWRQYMRIAYLPGYLFIFYHWIFPESIRWLMSNGKSKDIVKSLKQISQMNRQPLTDNVKLFIAGLEAGEIEVEKASETDLKEENPVRSVINSRIMVLRVINCSFCWIVHALVYYGLGMEAVLISQDKYLNFILSSVIEIPGYFVTYILINPLGRIPLLSSGLIISGIACTSFHFVPHDSHNTKLILFLFGKLAITVSFTTLYVVATEFYPTSIRNSLVAFSSTMGRIGSMVSPQVALIAEYVDPFLVFGGSSLLAGVLSLYFPETRASKLPGTIKEAELLGKMPMEDKQAIQINSGLKFRHTEEMHNQSEVKRLLSPDDIEMMEGDFSSLDGSEIEETGEETSTALIS